MPLPIACRVWPGWAPQGGVAEEEADRGPVVDAEGAVAQFGDRPLHGGTVLLLRPRVHDQRRAEGAGQCPVREVDGVAQECGRRVPGEAHHAQRAGEHLTVSRTSCGSARRSPQIGHRERSDACLGGGDDQSLLGRPATIDRGLAHLGARRHRVIVTALTPCPVTSSITAFRTAPVTRSSRGRPGPRPPLSLRPAADHDPSIRSPREHAVPEVLLLTTGRRPAPHGWWNREETARNSRASHPRLTAQDR